MWAFLRCIFSAGTCSAAVCLCFSDVISLLPPCRSRCAALRGIRDDIEKEHAFLGLCALLRLNPQVGGIHAT